MGFHHLVNTRYFSEAAIDWKKNGGRYTTAPKGSRDYFQYWEEQERRCKFGYKVGDLWIPGRFYFFLNFFPIWKVPDAVIAKCRRPDGTIVVPPNAEKEHSFPSFWEVQYEWQMFKYIAWYGGEFMGIKSPGGKHLCALKSRGAGWSYSEAADGVYNYVFIAGSKSYYFAGTQPYLDEDGIMNKVQDGLDWVNEHCNYWKQNRQVKKSVLHQRASYLDAYGVEKGKMSEIIGQVVDKPSKTRGKRGRKASFEEFGSFPHGEKALRVAMGSLSEGTSYVGQISCFGCVCAGTEVYKADGTKILIENLKQEDGILGYNGTGISQENITWMQPPAEKECVEITLETGITLRCSIDHPILATQQKWKAKHGKTRRVAFVEAQDLSKDYMVAVIETVPFFGTKHISQAYTLGYLIGDGYYGGTMEVIVDNDISLEKIESEVSKIEVKRVYSDTLVSYSIGGDIREMVKSNGMWGQAKLEKRFPLDWKEYDRESLAILLAGYFDADGNIKCTKNKGVSIIYSSIVVELLETVKEALLKFGVHSNIVKEFSKGGYTDGHVIYRLYIGRSESVENFRKNIPTLNPWKIIPPQTKKLVQTLRGTRYHPNRTLGENYKDKSLSGAILYKITNIVHIGKQKIYNLNAGNTHSYIANGIITHNTGGEQGPGIQALENVFGDPDAWDMLRFPNIWEPGMEMSSCGYFVPCYRVNSWFMDKDGNINLEAALKADEDKRLQVGSSGKPKDLDDRKAEYPRTPSEALQRLNGNGFNIAEIDAQIRKIDTNPAIQGLIRHGTLTSSDTAISGVDFVIQPKGIAQPIEDWPHKQNDELKGCLSIVQRPCTDQSGRTPEGMYMISFDSYYKDESEDLTSLFSFKVWKQPNLVDPSFDNLPVAWFAGRRKNLTEVYNLLFMCAKYYNAKIQGEISGGGQGVFTHAKTYRLLQWLKNEPEMIHNKELASKSAGNSYLMNMTADRKKMGLQYLEDWHMQIRSLDDKGALIYNINYIYDRAFLMEMKKFNPAAGNYDRVSDAIVAMFELKEAVAILVKSKKEGRKFMQNRVLFGGTSSSLQGTTSSY